MQIGNKKKVAKPVEIKRSDGRLKTTKRTHVLGQWERRCNSSSRKREQDFLRREVTYQICTSLRQRN